MPRTDRHQVFKNGQLQSETTSTVSDDEILQEGAAPRLRSDYDTLRQWSKDGQAAFDDWPNKTQAQKDAVLRETIRRLSILADRLADTITVI